MYEIHERLDGPHPVEPDDHLPLTHEQRSKARLRAITSSGEEARLFLDHGRSLQLGDYLRARCGRVLRIEGAEEALALARCEDWLTFARACYHLGNRHTKIQVGERSLRLLPDHVLEQMLVNLGLTVSHEQAVFVPEEGAYHAHHKEATHRHDTQGSGHVSHAH